MIEKHAGQVSKAEAIQSDWFTKRGLKVLNYQTEVLTKVKESLKTQEVTILAACPSAGKTLMAIYLIEDYLRQNPSHKVLVLAHGTTILRSQFHDSLIDAYKVFKPDFDFNLVESFNEYDNNASVNVCLPQTLSGKILSKANLLVVDEAHHFYFADMIKSIIKSTTPLKQLLLTGTPSRFIRRNFPIIPVTLNTIFDEGMVSDVYVEIATSSYNFGMNDFNQHQELKSSIHFRDNETKKTLDDLLGKIVERLKTITKGDTYITTEWLPTLKKLHKTMFVCKSQTQAWQVNRYFNKIGIISALSTSHYDTNSLEIERFKQEDDCLALIVVGRGVLGFNYPELVNVVDMTTSLNVDRVYQLLSRVIRKHPSGQNKLFFKIASTNLGDYYKYFMTGVLALCDESFFTKFNGKNFDEFKILVRKNNGNGFSNGSVISRSNQSKFKPIVFEGLPILAFFRKYNSPKDAVLNKFAIATIRDVRSEFLKIKAKSYWIKEKCIESARNYQKIIDWQNNESGAYNSAIKNGWLEECTKHMIRLKKSGGYWTKERCIESARSYQRISDWIKKESGAYQSALRNNWMVECTKHMIRLNKSRGYWTKQKCIESASNYVKIIDWHKENSRAYRAALKNCWLEDCTAHMKARKIVTKEECLKNALKYQSKKDWKENDSKIYNVAKRNGWFKECSKHMMNPNLYWTKERCKISASKYPSINEWVINANSSYQSAFKHGWVIECTSHLLKKKRRHNGYWKKELSIENVLKNKTFFEWTKAEIVA